MTNYKRGAELRYFQKDHLYVNRGVEENCINLLRNDATIISILAPRQSGKTSLMNKIRESFVDSNYEIPLIGVRPNRDYSNNEEMLKHFYLKLIECHTTNTTKEIKNIQKEISDLTNYENYFVEFILKKYTCHLPILCYDELDILIPWNSIVRISFFNVLKLLVEKHNFRFIITSIVPLHLIYGGNSADIRCIEEVILNDFNGNDPSILSEWVSIITHLSETEKLKFSKLVFSYTNGHPLINSRFFIELKEKQFYKLSEFKLFINNYILDKQNQKPKKDEFYNAAEGIINGNPDLFHQVLDSYEQALKNNYYLNEDDYQKNAILFSAGLINWTKETNIKAQLRCEVFTKIYNQEWINQQRKNDRQSKIEIRKSTTRNEIKNIFIINCGGTIGMLDSMGEIRKPTVLEFKNMYGTIFMESNLSIDESIELIYSELDVKDGANMYPEDWEKLAQYIYDKRVTIGYDGFVVLHGTDTLAYTASAVSFALGRNLDFPVIFTGAQATHSAYYGDAYQNFSRAIKLASLGEKLPEVVVCFNDNVYRAVRAEKANDYLFSGFVSNTMKPLAFISQNVEISDKDIIYPEKFQNGEKHKITLKNKFETMILKISQSPGLHNNWYKKLLDEFDFKAVIIESLGAGNLPTYSEYNTDKYEFISLIEFAFKKKIPVVITSKYPINSDYINKYEPSSKSINAGGIWAGNLNSVSSQVKLMWLLPQLEEYKKENDFNSYVEKLKTQLLKDFVGEIDKINLK